METFIMDEWKFIFKVAIIGDSGVGKSSLVQRFTQGEVLQLDQAHSTESIDFSDFSVKTFQVEDETVKLHIWDNAGQGRLHSISPSFYLNADALILVYDVTRQPTFDYLLHWMTEMYDKGFYDEFNMLVLVGNKCDKVDKIIPTSYGELVANYNNMSHFLEISARDSENVAMLFNDVAAMLIWQKLRMSELRRRETKSFIGVGRLRKWLCCF
ncbi:ras-related protein Rab-30-like [Neocloeon triangulifer]|uniref:ras-related protein Rab-30-like n=1 Tax=Neocloeon triangulifer TaxID=2078957 RepID=UPI00286F44E2|nr:ras-related protein Rab-30-like [Neocloeon triangulifer]